MQNAEALPDLPREGKEAFEGFDVNTYTQQLFGMFNGPVKQVTLRCENRLAGAMFDRFGTRPTPVICPGGDKFEVTVTVQVSPQFFGWVAGFAGGVEITAPRRRPRRDEKDAGPFTGAVPVNSKFLILSTEVW